MIDKREGKRKVKSCFSRPFQQGQEPALWVIVQAKSASSEPVFSERLKEKKFISVH